MSSVSTILGLRIPQKRRVFFSFHYQNDIWRVNQVRNSWRYQHEQQREAEGFFDGSVRVRKDFELERIFQMKLRSQKGFRVRKGC